MLISKLEHLKQCLAFRRIYLSECLTANPSWIMGIYIKLLYFRYSLAETKIVRLQQRLSFLCSIICSCLVLWDDSKDREDYQSMIERLIRELHLDPFLITFIDNLSPMPRFDSTGSITGLILTNTLAFSKYAGITPLAEEPKTSLDQIQNLLNQISSTGILDANSLNQTVTLIGKRDSVDWSNHFSTHFFKGKLN